ncbi:armadillo repeat-containing protein 10-like [Anneissia japonica]|uniref:armadillo repeat-containing protein 10-like n=1 Tax=Anneissia japonica TaxID=1529436 RepID=UPI0014259F28|nr:armadillo repeat-containing protein 10-like [Anneissia japonica]
MSAPYRLFSGRLNVTIISIFAASASICAAYKLFEFYNKLKVADSKQATKDSSGVTNENGSIPKDENDSKKPNTNEAAEEITIPVQGVLSKEQISGLIKLLQTNVDDNVLQKILTTIANASAFQQNQDLLREMNGIEPIVNMLRSSTPSLKTSSAIAVANLSLNPENNVILQECIPDLCSVILMKDVEVAQILAALQALTNLSLITPCSSFFHQSIQCLFDLLSVDDLTNNVKLQTLKVLVNLSCDEAMIESLLKAEPPAALLNYLQPPVEDDHALRVLTLFANVTKDSQVKERVEEWKQSRKLKKPSEQDNSSSTEDVRNDPDHVPSYSKHLSMIQEEEEEVDITENNSTVRPATSVQSIDLIPDNTLYDMVHGNSSLSLRCYVMMLKLYDHDEIQVQANRLWNYLY